MGDALYNPGDGVSDRSTTLVGGALNLADLNNEFIISDVGSAELGDSFSISAWSYLARGANNGSDRFHLFEASSNVDVSWGTNPAGTAMRGFINNIEHGAFGSVVVEQWQHVLHVFDSDGTNTSLTIYLDGVALGAPTIASTSGIDFSALHFGDARNGASDDRDWDGMIDEIGIWDRALSADEAAEVYGRGNNGLALIPEPGTATLLGFGAFGFLLRRRRR